MAYTTAAEVKAMLGISGTGDDAILAGFVAAAQKILETYCNRVFEAAADTTRYRDADAHVEGRLLWLDYDLCQITTVTNGDGTVLTTDDYTVRPRNTTPWYALELKQSSASSWTYDTTPENAIAILGRHAYSVTAPADMVHATKRLAAFLYRQKDAQTFDTTALEQMGAIEVAQSIPKDVRALAWPYRRRIIRP